MSTIPGEDVTVKVRSFSALFDETDYPLAIDTYQRGFVWGEDKIRQLIQDLQEFCETLDESPQDTPD
jgi:uncharacterized protein with ParB-like and HNH nuclease domain